MSPKREPSPEKWFRPSGLEVRAYSLIILAVAAPLLGGGAELWERAIIALGTGLLLVFAPPVRRLGRGFDFLFAFLAFLPLMAFLPTGIGPRLAWREWLPSDFPSQLGSLRTAQPWLTVEGTLVLWTALLWGYCAFAQEWPGTLRQKGAQMYSFGILVITAVFLYSNMTHTRIPIWPPDSQYFGFFPNRNHTGNVIALAGLLMVALGVGALRKRRRLGLLWLIPLAGVLWALVCNYSRAGILLFFGGITVWLLWTGLRSSNRKPAIIGINIVLLLFVIFFAFGGDTLDRFKRETLTPFASGQDLRTLIHGDAWTLSVKQPLFGIGLGNFAPVFAMARTTSAQQNFALHPESDWLWTAVELGWLAPVCILGAFILWLVRCFPLERGTQSGLRSAAVVAVCAFALHSVYDVAGHRFGAALPLLFFASIALHPKRIGTLATFRFRIFFRAGGVLLILAAAWWLAVIAGADVPPTALSSAALQKRVEAASLRGDDRQVIDLSSRMLQISPLEWTGYYHRGRAYAHTHEVSKASADFAAARALQPTAPDLCVREGQVWLSQGDAARCFSAWKEALRRDPEGAEQRYASMIEWAQRRPALREALRTLAEDSSAMSLVFLDRANRFEFQLAISRLLDSDPHLAKFENSQKAGLFRAWWRRGNPDELISQLEINPAWQKAGWPWLAQAYAARKDFARAYGVAHRFIVPPQLPADGPGSIEEVERRYLFAPANFAAAYQWYRLQAEGGNLKGALATLERTTAIPNCPAYFYCLKADVLAKQANWEEAWNAIQVFHPLPNL